MKRFLGALFVVGAFVSPAYAGSLAVTPGSGATVGTGTDGTNQIPATILCGATSSATLYATCVNQAIVNGSGQLLVLATQSGTWTVAVSGTVASTQSGTWTVQPGNTANTTAWLVTGTGGTFPVTGTFWQATQPISASSLPLPTGAATSALQTTINTTLGSPMQNSGGSVTANLGTLNGAATAANQEVTAAGTSATSAQAMQGVSGGVAMPMSAASLPLPTGAATSANQSTEITDLGTISTNTGNSATSANQPTKASIGSTTSGQTGTLMMGSVTTSAPTYTTAQTDPFSIDTAGNLRVNCITGCSGSGGTSSSFSATFPSTGTAAGAEYLSSPPTLTSGQMVALQTTSAGSLHTTVDNTNANGSATSANSAPVVIASDQAAVAMKAASGAFASGSIASGAAASGAFSSGALVDITNLTGSKNAGTAATDSLLAGSVYNSSPITLTSGQQASLQSDSNGYLNVHVQAGGGSGGTSSSFAATFPSTGTAAGAEALTSAPSYTSGQMDPLWVTTGGLLETTGANGTFPATESGTWNITNISGTVSLPTGAATAANQEVTAAGTSATSAQGVQGVTGGVAMPVSAASLPLPSGAATSALQTTINTTLGSPFQAGGSIGNTSFGITQGGSALTAANGLPTAPSPYPAGSTPITASATGTTAATTATLTNITGHMTYICGFSIRANATAAATGNATVTGTISGTLNFTQWTAPLASGLGVTEEVFAPCIPASAVSTSIAAVSAAPGSGGTVSVTAWGYSI